MDKTTHGHGESFAAFIERQRKEAAEAKRQSQEDTEEDGEDVDDDQYEEETTAAQATRKGIESCTDWFDEFRGLIQPGPESADQEPWEPPEEDEPPVCIPDALRGKSSSGFTPPASEPEVKKPEAAPKAKPTVEEVLKEAARSASTQSGRKERRQGKHEVPVLDSNIEYLNIRSKHHRNLDFSWAEVAILSELDFFMKKYDKACFLSVRKLAAVARVTVGTCRNTLKKLTADGVIASLGYNVTSINRIVTPEYSDYPLLSKSIMQSHGNK